MYPWYVTTMPYVDVFSERCFFDHPSKPIVKINVDVSWWLDRMHQFNSAVLQDSCTIVHAMVRVRDEKMRKVIDGRHQPSDRIMEQLVVGESLIGSVLIDVRDRDIIDGEIRETETGSRHFQRGEDMVIAVFIEGLSREMLHEIRDKVEIDVRILHVFSWTMRSIPYLWAIVGTVWEKVFLKPGTWVPGYGWRRGAIKPVILRGVVAET